jgi:hypothetical protein
VLHRVQVFVRTVGIVVVLLLLIVSVVFYFSDAYDLLCDAQKRFERARAGKPYHCYG